MTLKTLKDIGIHVTINGAFRDKTAIEFRDEARALAIKWVKNCDHRKQTWKAVKEAFQCSDCSMMIKFHNITEEDLK